MQGTRPRLHGCGSSRIAIWIWPRECPICSTPAAIHRPYLPAIARTSIIMAASRCTRRPSAVLYNIFFTATTTTNTVPTFLAPAFASSQSSAFSTTRPAPSKIGRAPLSLPPEVKFTVFPAASPQSGSQRVMRASPGSRVAIEGPRGKMEVEMPAFMSIEGDERTKTLRILDATDARQREMWGTQLAAVYRGEIAWLTELCRHRPRIPSKSHLGCQRRPYCYPTTSWGGLPSDCRGESRHEAAGVSWSEIRFT